jgi:hypothetical protein
MMDLALLRVQLVRMETLESCFYDCESSMQLTVIFID